MNEKENSDRLYLNFMEERQHILNNKWYMSEKAGHDVGFEDALLDWVFNHRKKWLEEKEFIKRTHQAWNAAEHTGVK